MLSHRQSSRSSKAAALYHQRDTSYGFLNKSTFQTQCHLDESISITKWFNHEWIRSSLNTNRLRLGNVPKIFIKFVLSHILASHDIGMTNWIGQKRAILPSNQNVASGYRRGEQTWTMDTKMKGFRTNKEDNLATMNRYWRPCSENPWFYLFEFNGQRLIWNFTSRYQQMCPWQFRTRIVPGCESFPRDNGTNQKGLGAHETYLLYLCMSRPLGF